MKNAFVLVDHLGDNGTVSEGMILAEITDKRFTTLEKKGLVREATAAEVKDGYKPPFVSQADEKAAPAHRDKMAPAAATKAEK